MTDATNLPSQAGISDAVDGELRELLQALVVASGQRQDELHDRILGDFAPDDVLRIALEEYERRGYERRLDLAASLLADFGRASVPALRTLCETGRPECEHFVSTIAHLAGTTAEERIGLLGILAGHPDEDVRAEVLEALASFDSEETIPVLSILAEDDEPGIREESRERLDELAG